MITVQANVNCRDTLGAEFIGGDTEGDEAEACLRREMRKLFRIPDEVEFRRDGFQFRVERLRCPRSHYNGDFTLPGFGPGYGLERAHSRARQSQRIRAAHRHDDLHLVTFCCCCRKCILAQGHPLPADEGFALGDVPIEGEDLRNRRIECCIGRETALTGVVDGRDYGVSAAQSEHRGRRQIRANVQHDSKRRVC